MDLMVAIPTMDIKAVIPLINSLLRGTVSPNFIFVINNSKTIYPSNPFLNTLVSNSHKNIGVNASWNLAIDLAINRRSHLMIINDDIKVKPYFFEQTMKVLNSKEYPKASLIIPSTCFDLKRWIAYPKEIPKAPTIINWSKREGWAFTMKNIFLKSLPKIPEELFTFCGDDWIWKCASNIGQHCIMDTSNIIFHSVGRTLKKNPKLRSMLLNEKRIFNRLWGI